MNTLQRLEEWKDGHKARSVEISIDDGYGASSWFVTLHGKDKKEVRASEVSFFEHGKIIPEHIVFVDTDVDEDWPGLERTINAALDRAGAIRIMKDEYDFSNGVRGKYADKYAEGAEYVEEKTIPINECIHKGLYRINSRNLDYGICHKERSEVCFIGIRTKFGERFLDSEIHYDEESKGTASPKELLKMYPFKTMEESILRQVTQQDADKCMAKYGRSHLKVGSFANFVNEEMFNWLEKEIGNLNV